MSTRIAVMTDVHANLPALRAALGAIQAEGCDLIFHTGDAIAIGPQPFECLSLLLRTPNFRFMMGNHDAYFVDGVPQPQPDWMSDGEVEHQLWTHKQLAPQQCSIVADWPYIVEQTFNGVKVTFLHYALVPSGLDFAPLVQHPDAIRLDHLFENYTSQLIFFGHDHWTSDLQGRARYVNPGSLGCQKQAVAPYCIVEFEGNSFSIVHRSAPYDDTELLEAFEERRVPERRFIYRTFFGGRLGCEDSQGAQ